MDENVRLRNSQNQHVPQSVGPGSQGQGPVASGSSDQVVPAEIEYRLSEEEEAEEITHQTEIARLIDLRNLETQRLIMTQRNLRTVRQQLRIATSGSALNRIQNLLDQAVSR